MRLAAQPLLELSKKQFSEIMGSMIEYRETLGKSDKAIFDVAFREVVKNNRVAELDGMQMKSMKAALEYKAVQLLNEGKIQGYINYRCLAAKIHTKLVSFQEFFGAEIIKTACAGTQTA